MQLSHIGIAKRWQRILRKCLVVYGLWGRVVRHEGFGKDWNAQIYSTRVLHDIKMTWSLSVSAAYMHYAAPSAEYCTCKECCLKG